MRAAGVLAGVLLVCAGVARAQNGDRKDEAQPDLPKELVVPSAPALSAEDEARTFRVSEGLRVELVAAEPLVQDPVVCVFDADGSLWVVEMRAYMPNVDGTGEQEPSGCVAHLFDDDGDGRMDRRVTFLDRLVLPRAIALTRGGVLVIAPPKLLFATDEDGDGVGEEVVVLDQGLGGIQSPEWAINALLPTLDNAWYCANVPWRYVWRDGRLQRERVSAAGQWGAGRDDVGRIYTNNNSDPLRVDAIDAVYAARNGSLGNAVGVNVRVVDDMSPRPARMNVGVNRGYQKGVLDGEYRLASVTGACAPLVHRGTGLGEEYKGDAFVCEPTGNLVLRYRLAEAANGAVKGEPVRNADGLDWLTSSDERFRPVWMCDGPDGAVYVCDMYRGLIQHRLFVTSFLRKQVLARGLEKPVGMGRVWRVVSAKRERVKATRLDQAEVGEVVKALGSPNGWTRDTAQRRLVEEFADSAQAHELVRGFAMGAGGWLGRVHALYALQGMGGVTKEVVESAFGSEDVRVRIAGVVVSEELASADAGLLVRWRALTKIQPGGAQMLRQVVLSLGEVKTAMGLEVLLVLMREACEWEEMRSAAASGLGGRELETLERIAGDAEWRMAAPGRAEFVELLVKCVAREGRGDRLERLVGLCDLEGGKGAKTARVKWQVDAVVRGVLAGRGKDGLGKPTAIRVGRRPSGLSGELEGAFVWPGKEGLEEVKVRELTAEEGQRFEKGRGLYESTCVQCHMTSGMGQTGQAPPLRGSQWVLGKDERAARVLLQGLRGEIEFDGERWDGEMPAVSFGDEEVAAILTYVRREWGNSADPVLPETIAKVREATKGRKEPWTVKELEAAGK